MGRVCKRGHEIAWSEDRMGTGQGDDDDDYFPFDHFHFYFILISNI